MQEGPDEADALKARLAKLASDLQARREDQKEVERKAESDLTDKGLGAAMSLGFRVMSEFVAATVVSALIGWQIDEWLETSPVHADPVPGIGRGGGVLERLSPRGRAAGAARPETAAELSFRAGTPPLKN